MNLLFVAIILVVVLSFLVRKAKYRSTKSVIVVDLFWYIRNVYNGIPAAITKLAKEHKAKAVIIDLIYTRMVYLTHPDSVKLLCQGDETIFTRKNFFAPPGSIPFHVANKTMGFVSGDEWRQIKDGVSNIFSFNYTKELMPIFIKLSESMLNVWEKQNLDYIDVSMWAGHIVTDVIGNAALGLPIDTLHGNDLDFEKMYQGVTWGTLDMTRSTMATLFDKIPSKKNKSYQNDVNNMVKIFDKLTDDRRTAINTGTQSNPPVLLDGLLLPDCKLDKLQLYSTMWGFTLGLDSASNVFAAALYLLAKFPEYQKLLHEEIDSVLKDGKPTSENIKNLEFMEMVIKEAMRYFSSLVSLPPRYTTEDVWLDDTLIPTDTRVTASIYTVHHLEEFWPNPEKFDPFRFSQENSRTRHPYSFVPFNMGKHHCIGKHFAMFELKVFIGMLFQKYSVKLVEEPVIMESAIQRVIQSLKIQLIPRCYVTPATTDQPETKQPGGPTNSTPAA